MWPEIPEEGNSFLLELTTYVAESKVGLRHILKVFLNVQKIRLSLLHLSDRQTDRQMWSIIPINAVEIMARTFLV